MAPKPKTIDEFLATVDPDKRSALNKLRGTIQAAAPQAEECISYGVPAFRLQGRFLVAFAAAARHCSFFPGSGPIETYRKELAGYSTSKGTIRFAAGKPLPAGLVRKLVKARLATFASAARLKKPAGPERPPRRFPPDLVRMLATSKIMGIRVGQEAHRFIGIWVVVARGRVFVRSWDLGPDGWFHTLRANPVGRIQVGTRQLRIRARAIRSAGVLQAVDEAYAEKYSTPGSLKYVRGLRRGRRRASTTELLPG